jgi:hypothetical protein
LCSEGCCHRWRLIAALACGCDWEGAFVPLKNEIDECFLFNEVDVDVAIILYEKQSTCKLF